MGLLKANELRVGERYRAAQVARCDDGLTPLKGTRGGSGGSQPELYRCVQSARLVNDETNARRALSCVHQPQRFRTARSDRVGR